MRCKAAALVMLGACSDPTLDSVDQQVADPAPILSITDAQFHNVVGGTMISMCGQAPILVCTTAPTHQVRWGQPAMPTDQSGLGWEIAGAHTVVYGTSFPIG